MDLARYLRRHHCGDWGEELCAEDQQANEDALHHGTRLLSCYRTPAGDRLYIITEWDRSMTTILLPRGILTRPCSIRMPTGGKTV